jgi:hypothetical protein
MKKVTLALFLLFFSLLAHAQSTGIVAGTVRDRATQETLPGVSVTLEGTTFGTATDAEGRYRLTDVPVGSYNLRATFVGYDALLRADISVSSGNVNTLNLEVNKAAQALGEVTVTASRAIRVATAETPLSVQRLTTEEIKSNPGGNFDISRVVQSLPGVGGGAAAARLASATTSSSGAGRRTKTCITWMALRCPSSTTFPRRAARAARPVSSTLASLRT